MLKTIEARCVNGALVSLETVELRERDKYRMTLDALPAPLPLEGTRLGPSTAGAWQKDDEYREETQRILYEARSPTPVPRPTRNGHAVIGCYGLVAGLHINSV